MKLIIKTFAASAIGCVSVNYAFAAPDPALADSPTPSTQYNSPFKDYRPLGDDKRTPWRDANDEVGKIGGWRVYLRESQEAAKGASAAAPTLKPAPSGSAATPAKLPATDKPDPKSNPNPNPKPSEHAGHGQHK